MNLFYRSAESVNGSQMKILEELHLKRYFDKCVVVDYSGMKDNYGHDFIPIDCGICYSADYDRFCDYKSLPELEGDIIEKMEKYKSVALNLIGLRPFDLYVGNYFYIESIYIRHLRFWNYILEKYNIGYAFFSAMPHTGYEYIVYALLCCKNIPTIIVQNTHILGLYTVGTSIENLGMNTSYLYKHKDLLEKKIIHDLIEDYKIKADGEMSMVPLDTKIRMRERYIKSWHKKCSYILPLKKIILDIWKKKEYKYDLHIFQEARVAQRESKDIFYYNRLSVNSIPKEKFVYFALQLTPEATTLPWAGVFSNQLLTVRLLAEILDEYGIKLCVKEHWFQPCRPQKFYDELAGIKNTILVNAYIDSYSLMREGIAAATQTGSCITESIMMGKPVICFAHGFWDRVDGIFVVKNKADIRRAVETIKKGVSVPKERRELYFSALENTCIRFKLDYNECDIIKDTEMQEDVVELISKFVDSGLTGDFIYQRSR